MCAFRCDFAREGEQVARGARQPVEAGDAKDAASRQAIEGIAKGGPDHGPARAKILVDDRRAGRDEAVTLAGQSWPTA